MQVDGSLVDWARADNQGRYSVVLPGPGKYLVLANAQGWAPHAEVLEFLDPSTRRHLTVEQQLTLSGTARRAGRPMSGALIILTEVEGGVVRSVHADETGHYQMPLPGIGRYIITALEPDTQRAFAHKVLLDVRSAVVDLEAPE